MKRARRPLAEDDPRHGTPNGYNNHRCRCDRCREAWRVYFNAWAHRTGRHRPLDEYRSTTCRTHGTISCYADGCRCDRCRAASRENRRRQRTNARERDGRS